MGKSMIQLNNITKKYDIGGKSFTALSVNVKIAKGEFVVITGRSGSGKSTFLNILTGIDQPTSGEVTVMGNTISSYSETKWLNGAVAQWGLCFNFFN